MSQGSMVLLDAAGRPRSPATRPGYLAGRAPRNKGMQYPPDPPRPEEIIVVMRNAGRDRHGLRIRALIAILWRGGPRISEALALNETDIDERRGSLLVHHGKGDKRREAGMDQFGFEQLGAWLAQRVLLPPGPLFCVIDGRTRGRRWAATAARAELRQLAVAAGVGRRFAPHHYADVRVMPMLVRRPCSLTQTSQVRRHNEGRLAWWCWTRIRDPFLLIDGVPRLFGVNSQCDATAKARRIGRVMPTSTQREPGIPARLASNWA